jgi:aldose 1-epimerase
MNTCTRFVGGAPLLVALLGGLSSGCESRRAAPEVSTSVAQPVPGAQPAPKAATAPLPIEKEAYGEVAGQAVERYTLTNPRGLMLKVITYGATVTELHVPDRSGQLADVVLGFDSLDGYVKGGAYFGATVGRVANRIGGAKFELDGKTIQLAANNGKHHLHGGVKGWDKVVWSARSIEDGKDVALELTHRSEDGEEAYPGNVVAKTLYTLTASDELRVEMSATTDRPTLVNMAHHSYWNLGGHGSAPVTSHELLLHAASYTPAEDSIPNGSLAAVKGTPFDFTTPKLIGTDLQAVGQKPSGFDHNWVVDGEPGQLRRVARLRDPKSGRVMTIESDQPGVQFYSGNFLNGEAGKGGVAYAQYSGACLETQKFPNAINVPGWREQVILRPGQTYKHVMIHRFSAQ